MTKLHRLTFAATAALLACGRGNPYPAYVSDPWDAPVVVTAEPSEDDDHLAWTVTGDYAGGPGHYWLFYANTPPDTARGAASLDEGACLDADGACEVPGLGRLVDHVEHVEPGSVRLVGEVKDEGREPAKGYFTFVRRPTVAVPAGDADAGDADAGDAEAGPTPYRPAAVLRVKVTSTVTYASGCFAPHEEPPEASQTKLPD